MGLDFVRKPRECRGCAPKTSRLAFPRLWFLFLPGHRLDMAENSARNPTFSQQTRLKFIIAGTWLVPSHGHLFRPKFLMLWLCLTGHFHFMIRHRNEMIRREWRVWRQLLTLQRERFPPGKIIQRNRKHHSNRQYSTRAEFEYGRRPSIRSEIRISVVVWQGRLAKIFQASHMFVDVNFPGLGRRQGEMHGHNKPISTIWLTAQTHESPTYAIPDSSRTGVNDSSRYWLGKPGGWWQLYGLLRWLSRNLCLISAMVQLPIFGKTNIVKQRVGVKDLTSDATHEILQRRLREGYSSLAVMR